ncbi:MAG: Zinc uptake regulation protein [Labilithrix sp.]|nr:Zinc uptake regulation protein [Labilithrix sp.]
MVARNVGKRTDPVDTDTSTLQARLRGAGLRSTGPRLLVLQKLTGRPSPVSHGELCEEMKRDGLDRATIYRNLTDLTEAGIVTRVDLGDHVWRFELRIRDEVHTAAHPHFVCSDCGTVSCLTDSAVKIVRGKRAPRSLGSKHVAVQITAKCDDCLD